MTTTDTKLSPEDTRARNAGRSDATLRAKDKSIPELIDMIKNVCAKGLSALSVYERAYAARLKKILTETTPPAPTYRRTAKRIEILNALLDQAVWHGGYGFAEVIAEGVHPDGSNWYIVKDRYEETPFAKGAVWLVDVGTIAKGLRTLRLARQEDRVIPGSGTSEPIKVWCDSITGKYLGFGGKPRQDMLLLDRTNGEDGDYDVIGAMAVLEIALFGEVTYA